MNQDIMDAFIQRNRNLPHIPVPKDLIPEYDQNLPSHIIYIWKNIGFGFCEHHAIQFVNPAEYQFPLFDFDLSILENFVFAITALGDLLIWNVPDNALASIWIYSLRDKTCTKLATEYELDRWFAQNLSLHFTPEQIQSYSIESKANEAHIADLALEPFKELNPADFKLKIGDIIARDTTDFSDESHEYKTYDSKEYLSEWLEKNEGETQFRVITVDERRNSKPEAGKTNATNSVQPQQPMLMPGPVATASIPEPAAPAAYVNLVPPSPAGMAGAIVDRLRKCKFEPVITLNPIDCSHALLDTKIGGPYYYPANENPPRNAKTGSELFLLLQINFTQLPKLKDFPETGLLQIFMDPNPHSFNSTFHPTEQTAWCIRYYPELPSYMEIDRKGYTPAVPAGITTLPFSTERYLRLHAQDTQQRVCWGDFPLNAMLNRHCADLMPQNPTPDQIANLREARKEAISILQKEFQPGNTNDRIIQMGGIPTFSNPDPRSEDPRFPGIRTPNVLLLQLPCFEGFNWGGEKVIHFFISRKALRERDFSNVLFDMAK